MHRRYRSTVSMVLTFFVGLVLVVVGLPDAALRAAPAATAAAGALSAVPTAPTGLQAQLYTTSDVIFYWLDTSKVEDGFQFEYLKGEIWTKLGLLPPDSATANLNGLACGTSFSFRVLAYNQDGFSAPSNVATVQTAACSGDGGGSGSGAPTTTRKGVYLPFVTRAPAPVGAATEPVRVINLTVSIEGTVSNRQPYEDNFRNFADAIYEASNGAHVLGRITFYQNWQNRDKADIQWRIGGQGSDCWYNAHVAGFGTGSGKRDGTRIQHCSTDKFGGSTIAAERDTAQGGYTLAHETGHYFYGLMDEYSGENSVTVNPDPGFPQPGDNAINPSLMNDTSSALQGDFSALNFSTPALQGYSRANAQGRIYGASAWETLLRRPSDDPRNELTEYSPRIDLSNELRPFGPLTGQTPKVELNENLAGARAAARRKLEFVWAGTGTGLQQAGATGYVLQIVIDRSAASGIGGRLDDIKAAVDQLINEAEDGDTIGILAYDGSVTQVVPLTVLTASSRATLKSALAALTASSAGTRATSTALQQALTPLAVEGLKEATKSVFFFSFGPPTDQISLYSALPGYKENFVVLYGFGFGLSGDAEQALSNFATETEGEYYFVSDTATLAQDIESANQDASPEVDLLLRVASGTVTASQPTESAFPVDAGLGNLSITLVYDGIASAASVGLADPAGKSAAAPTCITVDEESDPETYCLFDVENPAAGTWKLSILPTSDIEVYYQVEATAKAGEATFIAELFPVEDEFVTAGQKVELIALVAKNTLVTDLTINAFIALPDEQVVQLTLHDDGKDGDDVAGDGFYFGVFTTTLAGEYVIFADFNNEGGNAKFTEYSVQLAVGPNGKQIPYPAPTPVGVNFERLALLSIFADSTAVGSE